MQLWTQKYCVHFSHISIGYSGFIFGWTIPLNLEERVKNGAELPDFIAHLYNTPSLLCATRAQI